MTSSSQAAARVDRTAVARLQRLLALVPWVLAHPEASVEDVCQRFQLTPEQLASDLELLFVSGLPPYGPGDLIEAWVEHDRVHIGLADYFSRAPRMTWREAAGLYLAGRALAALPDVDASGALSRALAKLSAVLPADQLAQVQTLAAGVSVELDGDAVEDRHRATLAGAAAERRRVVLEYYTGSREELTRRTVDPWVVFPASGHWYLAGWCHLAGGERLFRLDRMVSVEGTLESFELPASFDAGSYGEVAAVYPRPGDLVGVLDLDVAAEWVPGYFHVIDSRRQPDGRLRVWLPARSLAWLVHLVLQLAPAAVPVAPPELRSAIAEAVRAQLAGYVG